MDDEVGMRLAIEAAAAARVIAHPNPWVGAALLPAGIVAATGAPGEAHAEARVLAEAGTSAAGATVYATLEPCCAFEGKRTPSCAEALVGAGVARVVIGLLDPDPRVSGRGVTCLRQGGVEVSIGTCAEDIRRQLAPYITHRATGRPFVVLKLAASLDGRTAAPDGTSRWITGEEARADGHLLRAESDAVLVGAGTVRTDDPSLTVRHVDGPDPRRVVLGRAPAGAKVHPCDEMEGDLGDILDRLGSEGVVQLLVEGGAGVAGSFHRSGLVDRYVMYLAPAFFGGDDAPGLFTGAGAPSIGSLWRGRISETKMLGPDLKVVVEARAA